MARTAWEKKKGETSVSQIWHHTPLAIVFSATNWERGRHYMELFKFEPWRKGGERGMGKNEDKRRK